MAGLRDLLEIIAGGDVPINFDTLTVFNTGKVNALNGGQCCLWTVPTGVKWLGVEMWGGGGAGAGGLCCQQGVGGGAGSYSRKFVTATPGEQFRICAAGSTGCCTQCCGQTGFASYIVRVSNSSNEICASGGAPGRTRCTVGNGCMNCPNRNCGSFVGNFGICGTTGSVKSHTSCYDGAWSYAASAPFTPGGLRGSTTWCMTGSGVTMNGEAHWPGGGGGSAVVHGGGQCWGGPGAGGLVNIYYGAET